MPTPYADPHAHVDPYAGEPTGDAIDEIVAFATDWAEPELLADSDLLASLSDAIDSTAALLERNARSRADDLGVDAGTIDFEPEARELLVRMLQKHTQAEIDVAFAAARRAGR